MKEAYKAAQKADVILWVIDSSKPNFAINFQKLKINIPILLVFNKMDLRKITEKEIPKAGDMWFLLSLSFFMIKFT